MGRAKQRMELITNKKTRLVRFEQRKNGMEKKAQELKTLCDVEVCMIIYGPRIDDRPVEAETWPKGCDSINRLISSYKSQQPEDRTRKTIDLSNFFQDRNQKIKDELTKLRQKNIKAKYATWDDQYDAFTKEHLMKFEHMLENKIQYVRTRIDSIKNTQKLPTSQNQFYDPIMQCFYGSSTVDVEQPGPWAINYNIPFPYEVDAGSNTMMTTMIPVDSYPINQIWFGQPPTPDGVMKLENGNLVYNTPLPIQSCCYPVNYMQQQETAPPNLLYHLEMANSASSHAHAVQMEDYYGSRDLQMQNFLCNF